LQQLPIIGPLGSDMGLNSGDIFSMSQAVLDNTSARGDLMCPGRMRAWSYDNQDAFWRIRLDLRVRVRLVRENEQQGCSCQMQIY
jgi:hypothetical protein